MINKIIILTLLFANLLNAATLNVNKNTFTTNEQVIVSFAEMTVQNDDWILCQITSKSYADFTSIEITPDHFQQGSLSITSYIRPGKIFTAHSSIINKQVAKLKLTTRRVLVDKIIELVS